MSRAERGRSSLTPTAPPPAKPKRLSVEILPSSAPSPTRRLSVNATSRGMSPRLQQALQTRQIGVKGTTVQLIKQMDAEERAVSAVRRESIAQARAKRQSLEVPPVAPILPPTSSTKAPRSLQRASTRQLRSLNRCQLSRWRAGDNVVVHDDTDSYPGTVLFATAPQYYAVVLDNAVVLIDVAEARLAAPPSVAPVELPALNVSPKAKESAVSVPSGTSPQPSDHGDIVEPELVRTTAATDCGDASSWRQSRHVSAVSSASTPAASRPELGSVDIALLVKHAESYKAQLRRCKDHLEDLKQTLLHHSHGACVLVSTFPSYFGRCDGDANDVCSVRDMCGVLHENISLSALHMIDTGRELSAQRQELESVLDVYYAGARVLMMEANSAPQHSVLLRRTTAIEGDVLPYTANAIALTDVRLQKLLPLPPWHDDDVGDQKYCVQTDTAEFSIHERVLVVDATLPGIVVKIASSAVVWVEFDDGDIDTVVPVANLRKFEQAGETTSSPQPTTLRHRNDVSIGDQVIVRNPTHKNDAVAQVVATAKETCDVRFPNGSFATHVPLDHVRPVGIEKPIAFATLDHVLAWNPRFERYCSGQVSEASHPTYTVVFDCGETVTGVPYAVMTTLDDASVLPRNGGTITTNWESVQGWEALDHAIYECHGNLALHKMLCEPKAQHCSLEPGTKVFARYPLTAKYFLAVVHSVENGFVVVDFASMQRSPSLPLSHLLSMAEPAPRHFDTPMLLRLNSTSAQTSARNRSMGPTLPPQKLKAPSFLSRVRTLFFGKHKVKRSSASRTGPTKTTIRSKRMSVVLRR
ncbi:hypothetical protein SPRG_22207 [Saprolegnia parasitica CBS 223.65]|uniref:SGF29 C-terminal domain-containing protein n=1 Tax=Saprolegnia parasitica (strain CBS 223.65) TaxID=695850 RepID=A0A067CJJ8_SAPPC|nr:hypothetical protein SPRG_22207 [Saprolegnia parasitica CBS 223.65]KDO26686.1 hypothetical protein SPRG_22207 [Saprolegnia parasitica CBS 223.65]|eukprot:XP_012202634.1 hypothetical protein SPRG_22207 [Saprolegnia parasitica CBS 223.65]